MVYNIGPNTKGRDFNHFERFTVSSDSFTSGGPDVFIKSQFEILSLINEGPDNVEFSYNGNTVHGDLEYGGFTASLNLYDQSANKLWFRLKDGGTSAVIRVQSNAQISSGGSGGGGGGGGGAVDTELPTATAIADAEANPTITRIGSYLSAFNGTTWDRVKTAISTATSTITGVLNSLPLGKYNTTPPSLTDGQFIVMQLDSTGNLKVAEQFVPGYEDNSNLVAASQTKPLAVSTYSYSVYKNYAAAATANVKASPGNVYAVTCSNINGSTRYIQIHNTATTPSAAAVPALSFVVPANSQVRIGTEFFGPGGINFSTGIAFAFSTTEGTYTAGTATDQFTQVCYK